MKEYSGVSKDFFLVKAKSKEGIVPNVRKLRETNGNVKITILDKIINYILKKMS